MTVPLCPVCGGGLATVGRKLACDGCNRAFVASEVTR